jgi:hypothetical protein
VQWRIDVAPRAAGAIRSLDAGLREEFIARIDSIASDPLSQVRRALPPAEPVGAWAYEYVSDVIHGLHVIAFFTEPDTAACSIRLAAVTTRSLPDSD